jgi:hypothetical protein
MAVFSFVRLRWREVATLMALDGRYATLYNSQFA